MELDSLPYESLLKKKSVYFSYGSLALRLSGHRV